MVANSALVESAWKALEAAVIYYRSQAVGTVAARDRSALALNYDQCFVRDFVSSAFVLLIAGKSEVVSNFLEVTLGLQSQERRMDCFKPGLGLIPASFKVTSTHEREFLVADFGEHAIARVTPIDSSLWWIIILRAYVKATGDITLAYKPQFQQGIRLILQLCLEARFDMFPTLLVPDGAFMIDRRMGVYGYPLEIQSLFYAALRATQELLLPNESDPARIAVDERLNHLIYHVQNYYWLNLERLQEIYRYKSEEFGSQAINKFNIYPASIPSWVFDWFPDTGGYFLGNLGPGQMDFRFFSLGNLMAIVTSLANEEQSQQIMNLIEERWEELVGYMPMKICFPALEGRDWELVTGCDPKNTPWSYHNGGNWPVLLWFLTAAAIKTGRITLAQKAIEIAERRLLSDGWPEYYDGKNGRLIGKEARRYQTWSITGFLLSKELMAHPENLNLFSFSEIPYLITCDL